MEDCDISTATDYSIRGQKKRTGATRRLVDPAPADALLDNIVLDAEINNGSDALACTSQQAIQRLRLGYSAWEAIQHKTLGALLGIEVLLDDANDDIIRHQAALLHHLQIEGIINAHKSSPRAHTTQVGRDKHTK